MAFPTVDATNTSIHTTGVTSHIVSLPAGIVSGNLLFIWFFAPATTTYTTPAGWTNLYTTNNGARNICYYRIADGSEGATVSVTSGASVASRHCSARVSGYSGTPEAATSTGSSTTPDPPNLAPSWGSADTLWLAVGATVVDDGSPGLTAPTNYSTTAESAVASSFTLSIAQRDLAASSENPGTFSGAGNNAWMAATIGVQPAAPAVGRARSYYVGA